MRNNELFKSATKFLPVFHGQYREMCSLAAVGQLGGPQMCELNEHVSTCASCREYLESVAQASVQVLPVLSENRIPAAGAAPPVGMRARFLARLSEETSAGKKSKSDATEIGVRFQVLHHREQDGAGTAFEEETVDPHEELVFQRMVRAEIQEGSRAPKQSGEKRRQAWLVWGVLAATAACVVIGVSGFYLGRKVPLGSSAPIAVNAPAPAVIVEGGTPPSDNVSILERDKSNLESELVDLKTKLSEAKADQDSLRNELSAANEKLASLQQAQVVAQANSKDVQDSKLQVAQLASEAERLRQRLAESETGLAMQQQRTQDVSEKLQITEANLQQELNVKDAKSQMGELVAARNLHIVDVYDADPSGKRQRAFGRVFYTEGKSLVFYAYDLEDARQVKTNVVFHVWGGKAGVKEVTHNLGILHKDDDGQSRWKMTFDDPNVLSQINSVFVTAEASNKKYDEPHGKKVLFAYFGSQPNHP